jgi:hypothetical protein
MTHQRCQRVTRDGAPCFAVAKPRLRRGEPHAECGGGWGASLSDVNEPPPLRPWGCPAAGPADRSFSTEQLYAYLS